jgi:addiction module HigA family antidote
MRDLSPIRPGEQLREEYVKPLGLTAYRLAKDIGVPVTRVQAIIVERGSRGSGLAARHRSQAARCVRRSVLAHHAENTPLILGDGDPSLN